MMNVEVLNYEMRKYFWKNDKNENLQLYIYIEYIMKIF